MDWLFGDSEEEKLEKEVINDLECDSIEYYNNYNNSGNPGIVAYFRTYKNLNKVNVQVISNRFSRKGSCSIVKPSPSIVVYTDKIEDFPAKIIVEVIGPLTGMKKEFYYSIPKAKDAKFLGLF